jgi:reactive intermediate/imine deaminase
MRLREWLARHPGLATAWLVVPLGVAAAQPGGKQIVRVGPAARGDRPFSPAVVAGDLIYVSGHVAWDEQGRTSGDIRAQTRRVLDTLGTVLAGAGASLDRAASVTVYLRRAEDFAAMNEVYATYWPKDPPARTTVIVDLVPPEALVEIALVAVRPGAERTVVHPPAWIKSPAPYSYGIKSGDTLFLAGLVSRNGRDNTVVKGDIATQVRTVLDNAGEILRAAGMSYANVASARVYLADAAHFAAMNEAYRPYWPKDPPARATVRAGLPGPDYLVEIALVAVEGAREPIVPPNPDGTPGKPNPNLTPAIRAGNRLFVSGLLGATPQTRGDARAQTAEALSRIGRVLSAAGFGWEHVVDSVVYLSDPGHAAAMNEVYRQVLRRDFPARATVGAGLMAPDALVEIMMTAVR